MSSILSVLPSQRKIKGSFFIDSTRDPAGNRAPFKWLVQSMEQGETSRRMAQSFAPPKGSSSREGTILSIMYTVPFSLIIAALYSTPATDSCLPRSNGKQTGEISRVYGLGHYSLDGVPPPLPFVPIRSLFIFLRFPIVLATAIPSSLSLSLCVVCRSNRFKVGFMRDAHGHIVNFGKTVDRWWRDEQHSCSSASFSPDSGIFIIHLSYFCFVFFPRFFLSLSLFSIRRESQHLETDKRQRVVGENDQRVQRME